MTNAIEVKFSRTYKLAGKDADSLSFREPKLADLIAIENVGRDAGQHGAAALLMAQLSGATQPEIAELSLPDYAKCDKALRPFTVIAEGGGD
ncbi:phage tail assembly protein [Kaistia adipata]|uniref:phage tail assembly protein n=1 Tax=Kaistia adipata TaxID=166954 RepID=UPI000403BDC7|nr:phage tail assembly protein [Kaistia adipata]